MYTLGISAFYHDSAACLFKNDQLLFACEEEKFTGIKHDSSFPQKTIDYIFKHYDINYDDIEAVCYYEDLNDKYIRVINNAKKHFLKNPKYSITSVLNFFKTRKKLNKELLKYNKIFYSKHHLSHQYYSFYTSDFNQATCLSVDGVGEIDTIGLSIVNDNNFKYHSISKYPHSLGLFYSAMTSFLGFKPNEGEYKVMGLASYGNFSIYVSRLKNIIRYENGKLTCDMNMFCWDRSNVIMYTSKLLHHLNLEPRSENDYISQRHKDLAYAVQYVYETILFKIIKDNIQHHNLCLSGGSAYNGTANGKIKKILNVSDLWIPVAPSDAGSCIGACIHYLHSINKLNNKITKTPFLGPSYSADFIIPKIDPNYLIEFNNDDDLYEYVAKEINNGKVVGWFSGNCEFGARALGNRSILGNPLTKGMRNKINAVIKKREGFRPFAPMVIKEKQHLYFDIEDEVPYMNQVVKVKFPHSKKLTEITHVDNTARVQTVTNENRIYKLLLKFEEYSGYPVLLNTSFNVKDKTMVLTPNDALNTFYDTEMDILVLERNVITKQKIK